MKKGLLVIAVLALLAGVLSVVIQRVGLTPPVDERISATGEALIGGPFTLKNQNGKVVKDADFRGKLMLVFFGFTHCPDICPTDLAVLGQVMKELGKDADKVAPIFVTIDPERDTVAVMKEYMSNFDPRIQGLTGTREQVNNATKSYRVYANKVNSPDGKDYTMDHSAFLYLMGKDGKYITHFAHNPKPSEVVAEIEKALGK